MEYYSNDNERIGRQKNVMFEKRDRQYTYNMPGMTQEDEQRLKRNRDRRIKKKRLFKRRRIFIAILLFIVLILVIKGCARSGPVEPLTYVNGIPVHQDYLNEGIPGRPGTERKVKYIVVHETGNREAGSTAASHNTYIKKEASTEELSWHYTVDENEIYQHLPDEEIGYHAGTADGNTYGIGVELCVNSDGDYEKTFENGAALVAALMKSHHLSIDDVKQHHDFSGKNCPEIMRESGRWDEFLDLVVKFRKSM